jgi:mannose-1-phosphate guanylyltransferase/mannose-6-phosphate isomerase
MIYPVVLAGGVGSRLWPLSRSKFPKQCLDITGDGFSMLQATLKRAEQIINVAETTVVCNEDHRFLVAEQSNSINANLKNIILEPVGKNTAGAIAVAAWSIYETNPKAVMLVLASDHAITDQYAFNEKVTLASQQAEDGKLVTFGIEPTYPETGYGYIKAESKEDVAKVLEFVEKPNAEGAQSYLDAGTYLWNSGMFMFRADVFLQELELHEPEIHELSKKAVSNGQYDLDFLRLDFSSFAELPSISVDYAVMEKTKLAEVVRFPSVWSDVGSWAAMWDVNTADENNNVLVGDVIQHNTTGTYVNAGSRLVTTVGVKDLIIIDTPDALLVANKNNAQDVKKIVEILAKQNRPEIKIHSEVYRPWGKYQTIDLGGRYQVKRITVKPGERLSTQMHHHRAEHWVVVTGTAIVRNGDSTSIITENESTYIPVGETHSLENPGKIPLELIEVQTGGYLGEDDIVRFDDRYGRIGK